MRLYRVRRTISAVVAVVVAGGLMQARLTPAWAEGQGSVETQDIAAVIQQAGAGQSQVGSGAQAEPLPDATCVQLLEVTSFVCDRCRPNDPRRRSCRSCCRLCDALIPLTARLCPP